MPFPPIPREAEYGISFLENSQCFVMPQLSPLEILRVSLPCQVSPRLSVPLHLWVLGRSSQVTELSRSHRLECGAGLAS